MKRNHILPILFGILVIAGTIFSGCVNTGTNTTITQPTGTAAPIPTTAKITAQPGDNISVIYTEMLENGTLVESNVNGTPVTFTLGDPGVIQGFQDAVIGMAVNEEKNVTIPYGKAYGPYRDELVHLLPLIGPLENETFVPGTFVTITNRTDNSYSVVKIINVTPDTVTWDENDPLAGQNLVFMINVTNIVKN